MSTESALVGILALMVEEREARARRDGDAEKVEVILDRAGLSYDDIAAVTGKKQDAVRMAITRSASSKKKTKKAA